MFFLQFIPDGLLHIIIGIVLASGILLYIVSSFLNFFPVLLVYKAPIKIFSILLIIIGIYGYGSYNNEMAWRKKLADAQIAIDKAQIASLNSNTKLAELYETKQKVIVQKQIVIQERIRTVEKQIDAQCTLDNSVIQILNSAAKNPLEVDK